MKAKLFCIAILFYASFVSAAANLGLRWSPEQTVLTEENEVD
jgi:hypothetical protein